MTDAIALDRALDGADPLTIPSFLDRRVVVCRAPAPEAAGARDRAASPDVEPPCSTPAALASAGAASLSEDVMPDTLSGDVISKAAERRAAEPELGESGSAVERAGIAADRLRSLVERIERLEEEKQALAGDIKEVFAEAKGAGFDTKIMRQVIKLRKMESDDRQEQETLLDLYKQALGMLS